MVSGEICATTAQKVRGMCGPAEGTASIDEWRGSFVCNVLTIARAHFVLCNGTGYFPGNGHEYCWPCAKTATGNTFYLIGGSIFIFSLWGLLSFGIDSMSAAILMNYLQVINMIQVSLASWVSLLVFAFIEVVGTFDKTPTNAMNTFTDLRTTILHTYMISPFYQNRNSAFLIPQS